MRALFRSPGFAALGLLPLILTAAAWTPVRTEAASVSATATPPADCGSGPTWPTKIGTDGQAGKVDLTSPPTPTTVAELTSLPLPSPIVHRVQPTEMTVYSITVSLQAIHHEHDRDLHLVAADGSGHHLITELPDPACVPTSSPFYSGIRRAYSKLAASPCRLPTTMQITGVGFFDNFTGQPDEAPNQIELHPILDLNFSPGAPTGPITGQGTRSEGGATSTVTPAPGSVTGRVTSASGGGAIAGATVSDSGGTATTSTDSSGAYTLRGLSPGSHTISAVATGFTSGSQSATVTSGGTTTVNFILTPAPGAVTGKVTSASGATPIAGATVSDSGCTATTIANSSGRYTLTGLAPGSHTITAAAIGFSSAAQPTTITPGGTTTLDFSLTPTPMAQSAVSTSQYPLTNSDGSTWQEIDSTKLRVTASPAANQSTLLSGNADLWTANAGFNQDLGISVSDNGAADQLLAWKESGGFAGTYSPNAAYVQHLYGMTGGHSYVFKLKWKTNKNASGATIYAGAGTGAPFSPTSLTAETFPPGTTPNYAVANSSYSLSSSDGVSWRAVDDANLTTTLSPTASGTAVLGANADLWTSQAGYNQDLGIFVSDNGGADTLVGWKESGGSAGTFSPNAAFVKAAYPVTGSHTYAFKLKWKANRNASGATIWAGAGGPGNFSPTSLFAQYIPTGASLYSSVSTSQYILANSDGVTWQTVDSGLDLGVSPAANTNAIVSGNLDLFTNTAGDNQDLGIFVSDNGDVDTLVAWKESGGFAGAYSPNAAIVQTTYPMVSGHAYVFKLKWKTNKDAAGGTIYAAAGAGAPFSPTRVTVELTG